MKFTVYILHSDNYSKTYTSITTDIEKTILHHNEEGNDWTKDYRPWKLISTREFDTKKEAMKYEKWLRSKVGKKFIDSLHK